MIDVGFQRSYIELSAVEILVYELTAKVAIAHSLLYSLLDICLVRITNIDGDYAFNFQVMSKATICADIPSVKKMEWFEKLHEKQISLCDSDSNSKN